MLLATASTGCYALQPVASATAVAENSAVAFDITDAGRVALTGPVGPSVTQVQGRLVRRSADEYVVAASEVHFIGGGTQVWTGEPIVLRADHIARAYSRQFSKSRTLIASALGVGAAVVIATQGVIGGGDPPSRVEVPDSVASSRGRRP